MILREIKGRQGPSIPNSLFRDGRQNPDLHAQLEHTIPARFSHHILQSKVWHHLLSFHWIHITSHIFSNYFIWVISLEVKGHLHNILSHGASYKVLHNLYPLHWYVYKCSDLIRVHSIHHGLQKVWLSPSCPRPTSNPPASSEASIIRNWPLSPPPSPPLFKPPSSLDWPQQ